MWHGSVLDQTARHLIGKHGKGRNLDGTRVVQGKAIVAAFASYS